jgi:threonine dehydrogenase-like Zn-dependent dehydrogenase
MWAHTLTAPGHFELAEVDAPNPLHLAEGRIIIRFIAGSICGSDLPHFRGVITEQRTDSSPSAPRLPGFPLHEIVGEIVDANGTGLQAGTRVVGWAESSLGLAELFVSRADEVIPVGDDSLSAIAATVIQPLACVLCAMDRIANVAGATVAVIGQGPLGVLFSHAAKSLGAARVIGVDRVDRAATAPHFGVDDVVWSSSDRWARLLGDSERPTIVIEAVGHQMNTLNDAVEAVAVGGSIYYFGIPDDRCYPFNFQQFMRKSLSLASGPTTSRHRWLLEAERYLRAHPALPASYCTHEFHTTEVQRAFEVANVPAPNRLKVSLRA